MTLTQELESRLDEHIEEYDETIERMTERVDTLEVRMAAFVNRVRILEAHNRHLISQVTRIEALINRYFPN
jgi:prefoldin subunit 5